MIDKIVSLAENGKLASTDAASTKSDMFGQESVVKLKSNSSTVPTSVGSEQADDHSNE